jgi:predicted amidohydrolase
MFLRYWENSVLVPGPKTDLLPRAAKEAKAYVVIDVTEKDKISDTLYCTLLYFSPEGNLIHKHRKLKPYSVVRVRTKHFLNIALVYHVGSWGLEPRQGRVMRPVTTILLASTGGSITISGLSSVIK